jgi:hypothetical protein
LVDELWVDVEQLERELATAELGAQCDTEIMTVRRSLHEHMEAQKAVAFGERNKLHPEQHEAFDTKATASLEVLRKEQEGQVAVMVAEHNEKKRVLNEQQAAQQHGNCSGEGDQMAE